MSAVLRLSPSALAAVGIAGFGLAGFGLAACTELNTVSEGEPDLLDAQIGATGDDRFAVSLTALNTDGYELARCLASGYVDGLRDDAGDRRHDVFRREGGQLTDEFRVVDGVRTQTSTGVQVYAFDPALAAADHDGRDVMAVDVQLARCDRAGLPTSAE